MSRSLAGYAVLVVLAVLGILGIVPPPAVSAAPLPCSATPEPDAGSTARAWQRALDGLSGAWAGGDATYTIPLGDGRVLWLWGDSFHGRVQADGALAPGSSMVRNAAATARGTRWVFVHGGAREFLASTDAGRSWFWPLYGAAGPSVVVAGVKGHYVWLFAGKVTTSQGALGFRGNGNALFRLWVPWGGTPKVVGRVMLPFPAAGTESGILWGAGVEKVGGMLYVYGTRRVSRPFVFGKELLLARVPFSSAAKPGAWRFWDGRGWSSTVRAAAVIRAAEGGVSTSVSADRIDGRWVLVTKKDEFLGSDVVALTATAPWGPFAETVLFRSPSSASMYTYQPSAHPELGGPKGTILVTINRNPVEFAEALRNPRLYRAKFRVVRLPR